MFRMPAQVALVTARLNARAQRLSAKLAQEPHILHGLFAGLGSVHFLRLVD